MDISSIYIYIYIYTYTISTYIYTYILRRYLYIQSMDMKQDEMGYPCSSLASDFAHKNHRTPGPRQAQGFARFAAQFLPAKFQLQKFQLVPFKMHTEL